VTPGGAATSEDPVNAKRVPHHLAKDRLSRFLHGSLYDEMGSYLSESYLKF
jgi:hypothetical protein